MIFGYGMVLAVEDMELLAPGGGELDLSQNMMKYFSAGNQPVTVQWGVNNLETGYLEYYRDQALIKGKDRVKLTQSAPEIRVLKSTNILVEINRDYFLATEDVNLRYDAQTAINCSNLEWDQKKDLLNITGKPELFYQDWKLTGERIEGHSKRGIFTFFGPIMAINSKQETIRAGKLVFDREKEKLFLTDHPVFLSGKNEMTANEMVYDLKLKKLTANGPVKSRVIE